MEGRGIGNREGKREEYMEEGSEKEQKGREGKGKGGKEKTTPKKNLKNSIRNA